MNSSRKPYASAHEATDSAHKAELPVDALRLRLYIAGSTPNSVRAEKNLSAVLTELGVGRAPLIPDVIDVFANGKRAVTDGVIVTPTLVVLRGEKRYTLVGDLSDDAQLRALLE